MGEKLKPVKADTAEDFAKKGAKAVGGKSLGDTECSPIKPQVTWDQTTHTVKKVKIPFTISITRAHYAGYVKDKPDDENRKAIEKMEALNKKHEEAHRDGYQKVFDAANLEDALVGKTPDEAKALIADLRDALRAECEKLHKKGGLVVVTTLPNGTVKVEEKPEGPGGCK